MRGETTSISCMFSLLAHFNPLPSCEGRQFKFTEWGFTADFNPLPSCEGRLTYVPAIKSAYYFNPLPSCEGRRCYIHFFIDRFLISIHSPHARGDSSVFSPSRSPPISIHSPHARGDLLPMCVSRRMRISIHSPHARGDEAETDKKCWAQFQSTPLMRGETIVRRAGSK